MRKGDDRVVAIMMKAPRAGWVKTRLTPAYSSGQILTLYRAFVEDTIDLVHGLGVRTVAVCPAGDETELAQWLDPRVEIMSQQGAGLAAGLRWTFEQLCGASRRRVIAFNADSPHLETVTLQSAFDALLTDDLVVGPCDDGGYYLVGATRPYPSLFDATVMGRGSACGTLLAAAARLGLRVKLSKEHYDIDVPGDLARLAAELSQQPWRAQRTAAILSAWAVDPKIGV